MAIVENTAAAWDRYKLARNMYKVKIEKEKNRYTSKKIENTRGQKEMWHKIKELVLKKPINVIKSVIFNNIEYKDNLDIANKFNDYFVNSIKEIRSSINNVQYENQVPVIECKFKFRAISLLELRSICKNIKKKNDYRRISTKLILDNWELVGGILLKIINKSMETGVFPENWKESVITPIEKIKNTTKCDEFRPINSLKTFEKIMESVVKQQLEKYLEDNKISKYQSGFRKKCSCETAVNYVISRWKKKKNKKLALFLDFKRAFETIDRDILLQKMVKYGIEEKELKWFRSYLTNRKQITRINNIDSSPIINDYGVPQGSILGALLFIIYINDIENVLENSEIVMYADDTLIFTEDETDDMCYKKLSKDMEKINKWLMMNKLKLNENKTKLLEINMNSNITFKINDVVIEKVNTIKYLGFLIDKDLKFKEHIEYICKKIGKKIGFFKRIRNKISIMTSIIIYNTIIKPHFEFGSTILYTCCSEQQLLRLQKLQNKAMRAILKVNRYTSIRSMLDSLRWLNIKERLELNTIHFIQKMRMGQAPDYLIEQLRYVGESQPYSLRNAMDFRIQNVRTSAGQNSLFYKGLNLYNMLPEDIKSETNSILFRKKIVNFVKNINSTRSH